MITQNWVWKVFVWLFKDLQEKAATFVDKPSEIFAQTVTQMLAQLQALLPTHLSMGKKIN